MEFFDIRFN